MRQEETIHPNDGSDSVHAPDNRRATTIRGPEDQRPGQILTPAEAAEHLRISTATLLKMSRAGEIPGFQIGKLWRYHKTALDEWLLSKVSFFRH